MIFVIDTEEFTDLLEDFLTYSGYMSASEMISVDDVVIEGNITSIYTTVGDNEIQDILPLEFPHEVV